MFEPTVAQELCKVLPKGAAGTFQPVQGLPNDEDGVLTLAKFWSSIGIYFLKKWRCNKRIAYVTTQNR